MELEDIYRLVQADLAKVERQLGSVSEVKSPHLAELAGYILAGGKGIRPALTLLSGRFYNYNLDQLVPMAVAVELLHTATLVHDDAIDSSMVRRGRATVNKVWDEDKAILLGDYLFAKAGEFVATTGNLRAIMLFSLTLQTISDGEINQSFDAFNLEQTREHYFQRISGKTASLFAMATESGAILSDAPEESVQILKNYGYNLGIAFQIVDDVLDFVGTEKELGKPVGSDLIQGTLTLPAMLILGLSPEDNPVRALFSNPDMPDAEKQKHLSRAMELVRSLAVVPQCYEIAAEYCAKACGKLELLPDNPSRQALKDLARLVLERKK